MSYIVTIEKEEIKQVEEFPPAKVYVKINERNEKEAWQEVKEYDWIENPNNTPKITEVKKTTGIYTQTVEELDIVAVINAVNKLKEK